MSHLYTPLPTLWKVDMLQKGTRVVNNYKQGSYEEHLHLLLMWNHLHLMNLDAIQLGPKLQLSSFFCMEPMRILQMKILSTFKKHIFNLTKLINPNFNT